MCYANLVNDSSELSCLVKNPRKESLTHGHQCSFHFQIFKIFKTSCFYVSKYYDVKYIVRYIQEGCMQKSPAKK
jgi:hypothetical protein